MTPRPQLSLFTRAPFSDHATSRDAAVEIGDHLARLESLVLGAVSHDGGMCAFEIEDYLELSGDTVRPRLKALEGKGLIRKTDRTRTTPSGRAAAVWEAV